MSITIPLDDAIAALQRLFQSFSGRELPRDKAIELLQSQSRGNFNSLVAAKK